MNLYITITASEINEQGLCQLNDDGTETIRIYIKAKQTLKAYRYFKRKYPDGIKIRYGIDFGRIGTFLSFFGRQNDYLFPGKGASEEEKERYPFPKAHLWKTRFGFSTAWNLAKSING